MRSTKLNQPRPAVAVKSARARRAWKALESENGLTANAKRSTTATSTLARTFSRPGMTVSQEESPPLPRKRQSFRTEDGEGVNYVSAADKAKVVVSEIVAAGGRAIALKADSADAGALTASIRTAVDKLGRLDILVNNAGVLAVAPLDQFSLDDFGRLRPVQYHRVEGCGGQ